MTAAPRSGAAVMHLVVLDSGIEWRRCREPTARQPL